MKPNPHEIIEFLAASWPKCFAVKLRGRRPLKIGVGQDLVDAAQGALTAEEISLALRVYTRSKPYWKALREGATRIDLNGDVAGIVSATEAAHARMRIERFDARESARTRARGLLFEEAARKAKAEAEAAKHAAEGARRAAKGRKPVLWLPRATAASAAA